MFKTVKATLARHARRLLRAGATRRFVRHQDASAAVEFGLVAAPFFAMVFAIMETAFVFFAGQTLEAAVANTSRLIMTGQAQTAGYSAADFKNAVCAQIVALFDCTNSLYVSVQTYTTFSAATTTPPVTNGQLNTGNLPYAPGGPGDIVVVQLYYQWPIYVSFFSDNLANLNGNKRLLVATAAFRNEPYQ
ncbi:MAG TPA: TadE/TadG family type IV pilus assembly protein [Pseudolabrys sp.]|jgi:Flp pilus assembly protein TadG|nr:TadE/TadG family type IV pilus assembly protein [Pseudolabrys sp.]